MIDRILKTYGEVNTTVIKHFPPEKKSLNHRFLRTKFSSYDFGAEFSIYRGKIYTIDYKTVWLI